MIFTVLPARSPTPDNVQNKAFLLADKWNDWGEYQTQYDLIVVDGEGQKHSIGSVKIGQFGMKEGQMRPDIPESFESLDDAFFSIGQDDSYYIGLNALGDFLRDQILNGLRDLALNPAMLDKALTEKVMEKSLLRDVDLQTIRGRFRRLARGDARLTSYKFSYEAPTNTGHRGRPLVLSFEVLPESEPPTNIHVLIGRNGVGKTHYLTTMTRALLTSGLLKEEVGRFDADVLNEDLGLFANLVSVAFSVFDPFVSLPLPKPDVVGMRYSYIGLKQSNKQGDEWSLTPKDITRLTKEFVDSIRACRKGSKVIRWRRALEMLEADPIFKETDVKALADGDDDKNLQETGESLFQRLSSGHKIVLLTITRLVEDTVERTLVLIDEPESHLHPPLLSAFIRALSDLLIQQNGVAIIATHSPVVLQEVPKSCVWKLRRSGAISKAERPESETFGENVGILTREVFGLEVTQSGFHRMLQEAVDEGADYEKVVQRFGGQLGAEARAIVRALIASKESDSQSLK
jgi:ABC-type cobalamin/Fe3+-siderophores transport system ATPase subunit